MTDQMRRLVVTGITIVGVALLLVAAPGEAVSLPGFKVSETAVQILKSLGQSLFVAGVLALTVEPIVRATALERVQHDVAPYFLAYPLPHEVVEAIQFVGGLDLIRKDCIVRYSFLGYEEDSDYLRVITEIRYTLVNYSHEAKQYDFRVGFTGGGTAIRSQVLEVCIEGEKDLSLDKDYYNDLFEPEEPAEKSFKVRPNREEQDNQVLVRTMEVFPRTHGDVLFMREPTLNVEVEVLEKPANLDVDVHIGTQDSESVRRIPQENPKRWVARTMFLPWQAVALDWQWEEMESTEPPDGPEKPPKGSERSGEGSKKTMSS